MGGGETSHTSKSKLKHTLVVRNNSNQRQLNNNFKVLKDGRAGDQTNMHVQKNRLQN